MSDSQLKPWSDNPNAPKISYDQYVEEKVYFVGVLLCSVLYGIIIVLFFQCISALFSSTNRRGEAIKWGLVFYTVLMFTVVTAYTATYLGVPVTISHTINTESATVIQLKEGVQSHTHVVLKDYQ